MVDKETEPHTFAAAQPANATKAIVPIAATNKRQAVWATSQAADKFNFKPTDAQQTFAERVVHIATTDLRLLGAIGAKTPAPAINAKATSKADALAALKASFAWGEAVIKEFNDAQLVERIMPPAFLGPSASRARVIYYSLQHTQDIYGQLVVYLRLNGITPPASNRGI